MALLKELGRHFRPEFLNRVDAIVRFHGLSREMIERIVGLELNKVSRALAEQELALEATPAAIVRIAELGWDPVFGARPVKRVIQREVQDRIADLILAGEVLPEQTLVLDVKDGEFTFRQRTAPRDRAKMAAGAVRQTGK